LRSGTGSKKWRKRYTYAPIYFCVWREYCLMATATTITAIIRTRVAICAWGRMSEILYIYSDYNELHAVCQYITLVDLGLMRPWEGEKMHSWIGWLEQPPYPEYRTVYRDYTCRQSVSFAVETCLARSPAFLIRAVSRACATQSQPSSLWSSLLCWTITPRVRLPQNHKDTNTYFVFESPCLHPGTNSS
jgi:hypothetical protein